MWFLASWRAILVGVVLAAVSSLVAREYLKPSSFRRPGLALDPTPLATAAPGREARLVGLFAIALAAAGFLLALAASVLLLRRGARGR